jgi:hypothetical protein
MPAGIVTPIVGSPYYSGGCAQLKNRYSFESNLTDLVTGIAAVAEGSAPPAVNQGKVSFAGGLNSGYLMLPKQFLRKDATPTALSLELWMSNGAAQAAGKYPRVFSFGAAATGTSLANTWIFGPFDPNAAVSPGGWGFGAWNSAGTSVGAANTPNVSTNASNVHVVLVINTRAHPYGQAPYGTSFKMYINGTLAAFKSADATESVFDLPGRASGTEVNYLGGSTDTNSPGFIGSIDEFRVWSGEMPASQVLQHFSDGPNHCSIAFPSPSAKCTGCSATLCTEGTCAIGWFTFQPGKPPICTGLLQHVCCCWPSKVHVGACSRVQLFRAPLLHTLALLVHASALPDTPAQSST